MSGYHYGDVVWADFDTFTGHEQTKRRPAVVVSNDGYNRFNNLVMVVPVTSAGDYPLHVDVGDILDEADGGVIHVWAEAERLKSLDLGARRACVVGTLDEDVLERLSVMVLDCLMRPTMALRRLA